MIVDAEVCWKYLDLFPQQIEAKTKYMIFSRQLFQMYFLD